MSSVNNRVPERKLSGLVVNTFQMSSVNNARSGRKPVTEL